MHRWVYVGKSNCSNSGGIDLAAAKKYCPLRFRFPALLAENPVVGGAVLDGNILSLNESAGLGIKDVLDVQYF